MTDRPIHDLQHDMPDAALDALLRRTDRVASLSLGGDLEARILARAAFPLAARRRDARMSLADTLAAWVRVAVPLAAAAALVAGVFLSRLEMPAVADSELRDSDPGALLSALEAEGSGVLTQHLIGSDAEPTVLADTDTR